MQIGDLVNSRCRQRLFCGSGMYPHAVVVLLHPFVLVSEDTDMRWDLVTPEEMEVVGQARLRTALRCLRRLSWRERWLWLRQIKWDRRYLWSIPINVLVIPLAFLGTMNPVVVVLAVLNFLAIFVNLRFAFMSRRHV